MSQRICGWLEWVLAVSLAIGLAGAPGCEKQQEGPPGESETERPDMSPEAQAALERLRAGATMPADAPAGPAAARPAATGTRPSSQAAWAEGDNLMRPTELFDAARDGNLEMVRKIMLSGGPVLVMDPDGATPLHWAAFGGHVDIIAFLLDTPGFKVDERNRNKVTPLHWAAFNGHRQAVAYLIERGAAVDAKDDKGRTPLFAAAVRGKPQVVDYLIQRGADVNAADTGGETPLGLARARGHLEVVKMLIDHGAQEPPATMPAEVPSGP